MSYCLYIKCTLSSMASAERFVVQSALLNRTKANATTIRHLSKLAKLEKQPPIIPANFRSFSSRWQVDGV